MGPQSSRAVAFSSWLPPTGPTEDFHLHSLNHAQRTTHRFAVLRRKIPGVSERMLTQELRELEEDGIVHREVYPEVPPKVEYSLTDYGKTLRPITEVMCE